MSPATGRWLRLSLPRRFIIDLVHFARLAPTVPVQRRMSLAPLLAARSAAVPRPSWCALFTKALGFVAAARPELRRAYLKFPWPHLYEHPVNLASIAVERQYADEDAVFFGRIASPEERSLAEIDQKLRSFKETPIDRVGSFRHALSISRWPLPVRRLIWWVGLNVFGRKRAQQMGTFGVSAYSGLGASSLHPLSPLSVTLNYGVVEADGAVDVRLVYDHRVLDGATVARALADLERVLLGDVLNELRYLRAIEVA
jgi:hypothetical protein